jgi:hypothetical protein
MRNKAIGRAPHQRGNGPRPHQESVHDAQGQGPHVGGDRRAAAWHHPARSGTRRMTAGRSRGPAAARLLTSHLEVD